jgi:hypothetical protein
MEQHRGPTTAARPAPAAVVAGVLLALLSPALLMLLAEAPSALTAALVVAAAALVRHGQRLSGLAGPSGPPVASGAAEPVYLADRIADPQQSPRRPRAPGRG